MTEELLPDPFRSENRADLANAIRSRHRVGLFEGFRLLILKVWCEKENRRGVKECQFKKEMKRCLQQGVSLCFKSSCHINRWSQF